MSYEQTQRQVAALPNYPDGMKRNNRYSCQPSLSHSQMLHLSVSVDCMTSSVLLHLLSSASSKCGLKLAATDGHNAIRQSMVLEYFQKNESTK